MKRFEKLLEPGKIGSLRVKNRMIKTGTGLGFQNKEDGYMNERTIGFFEALAKGGAGLIVTSSAHIDFPQSTMGARGYRIDDDKYIPKLAELAQAIHDHDCPALIQMVHMGPMHITALSGLQPVASSSLPKDELPRPTYDVARELSIAEIEDIIDKFATAAERHKKAGFDGIELNAGCNHLLNSFLSRAWNRRQDDYGIQSLENRFRIVGQIIREVKKRNGQDFAIIFLLSGREIGIKNGTTLEESTGFARLAEQAGADAIHVRAEFYFNINDPKLRDSTHFPDAAVYPAPPSYSAGQMDLSHHGAGGWLSMAAGMKQAVSIPVIAVGRLDAELGEKALREGQADFLSFNRRLMADPEMPRKITEGRPEDIAPCMGCLTCFSDVEVGQPARCRINAALGKEREYAIKPAEKQKRVMVIGGGPAGMEAARIAALRGHQVTIYEKAGKLGGLLPLAAMVKGFDRENLLQMVDYLSTQINKLGVTVVLGKEVTRQLIEEVKPDALVIATGGRHGIPDIKVTDARKIVSSKELHGKLKSYLKIFGPRLLRHLTRFWMPLGKSVVIMGGDIQGCQVAEFLVKRGRKVTIVDTEEELGKGLAPFLIRPALFAWLREKGVEMTGGASYEEITDKGLIISKDGKRQTITADTILTAPPLQPDPDFVKSLEGSAPEIHAIGDCHEPGLIIGAIAEGSRVGREI